MSRVARTLACSGLMLSWSMAAPSAAQTPPAKPASATPTTPAATPPERLPRNAVGRVVEQIARDLTRLRGPASIVAAPLTGDATAPRAAELGALIATQLAGRLARGAHARVEPLALSAARTAAAGDPALVHLTIEIAAGQLRVRADLYPVPRSVWSRAREPAPGPIAHAFAQSAIDAEVRTYLAPVPLSAAIEARGKNFEGDVVALACGDLDRDGALEIVSVSRRRVSTLRLRGGKVIPLFSRSWPDLSPVAPSPLREPIGFASLVEAGADPGAFVDVALSDRARSLRLDGALQVVKTLAGFAIPDGDGSACARAPSLWLAGPVGPCVSEGAAASSAALAGAYDAFASARLVSARGGSSIVWAGRSQGALDLRDDAGRRAAEIGVGAQLALGDLDQDGDPELVASLDTMNPLEDAIVVRTWPRDAPGAAGGRLREVARVPAPAGVRAIAVCPPDGPGRAPFVVATADELWVVR